MNDAGDFDVGSLAPLRMGGAEEPARWRSKECRRSLAVAGDTKAGVTAACRVTNGNPDHGTSIKTASEAVHVGPARVACASLSGAGEEL